MIKRTIYVVGGIGLLSLLLFGRDAFSYLSTSYNRVTTAVEDSVPVNFQIDRARNLVADLEPEIRKSMHVIAKEEVELENLNRQIVRAEEKNAKDKNHIIRLQSDLASNRNVFRYAGRTYSADEVRQDLSRRFGRFQVADDTLANLTKMRDARTKNLDAARQELSAMINARRQLEVDIQGLEAKHKLVQVAQASCEYAINDSQLAQAKQLISDIRKKLDVQAKLANADVDVDVEINLDESVPEDIEGQVAEYFGLNQAEEIELASVSL